MVDDAEDEEAEDEKAELNVEESVEKRIQKEAEDDEGFRPSLTFGKALLKKEDGGDFLYLTIVRWFKHMTRSWRYFGRFCNHYDSRFQMRPEPVLECVLPPGQFMAGVRDDL